jgi:hypothetical protein
MPVRVLRDLLRAHAAVDRRKESLVQGKKAHYRESAKERAASRRDERKLHASSRSINRENYYHH